MGRRNRAQELIDLLAEEQLDVDPDFTKPPPPKGGGGVEDDGEYWEPELGKTGKDIFDCDKKFILAHGERGSGKTFACLHKVVRHLYDNDGAMACITVVTRSSAILGGAWTKFQIVLNMWREGLGLEGEGKGGEIVFKMDDARNRFCWIRNSHGGWSMAFLKSLQHAEHIKERVKGMEFSIFFFDELTETDDERYFTDTIQQLGRLPGIHPQQFIGACNPPDEGEDHWVHKRFFQGFDDPNDKRPKHSKDYGVFHVPMSENRFLENRDEYIDTVMEATRTDPTAYDRLILGLWVKKPSGKGLLAEHFVREKHYRGDLKKRQFIIPRGNVIDIGYDIGTANTAITFEERVQTTKGELCVWFDEIVKVGKYLPIPQLVPLLLARMNYWCGRTGRPLIFNHIGDSASFDQMRGDGSYDALKLEEEVKKELHSFPERYPHLTHLMYNVPSVQLALPKEKRELVEKPVRMLPCPKPPGSRAARGRMMIARLQSDLIVVSARCVKHVEMFEQIEADPEKPNEPKKGSRHGHPFDSGTYVMYYFEMGCYGRETTGGRLGSSKLVELNP